MQLAAKHGADLLKPYTCKDGIAPALTRFSEAFIQAQNICVKEQVSVYSFELRSMYGIPLP